MDNLPDDALNFAVKWVEIGLLAFRLLLLVAYCVAVLGLFLWSIS